MRIIAIALSPVSPSFCSRIYSQLGYSKDQFEAVTWSDTKWGALEAGQVMAEPKPIFARIETRKEGEDGVEPIQKVGKDRKRIHHAQGVAEA